MKKTYHPSNTRYFYPFAEEVIASQKKVGKIRISETYTSAINSFKKFMNHKDIPLKKLDTERMITYETYLRHKGLTPNTTSFYMRNLRAIYNRAVEKGLVSQQYPFKYVYTGVEKTIKRAISLKAIKQIKNLELPPHSPLDYARDMFLFSFYTRGMAFIDMAYLKKKNLNNHVLSYRRRKTGQVLYIKWEKCMQAILAKYHIPSSDYLLPILQPSSTLEERKQYLQASHRINHHLKKIGKQLGIPIPLTMYVARHTWASIAKSKHIPISVISEGMGHDSETTTRIYLSTLDNVEIDKANKLILESL